ncbi:MAG TPA: beta-N-acetylhexosaminidase [Dongiaceae bacterium]|jgi:beta-N-acetylhexosaminidase|nr:beta-N-acetylhexosaminidase [Dongiaceae bacterium]
MRPVIFGLAGPALTDRERGFLKEVAPLGVILFTRNIIDPPQVRSLVASVQELLGGKAAILIDQEGGRVARLRPPFWREAPPARRFALLYARDAERGLRACYLNHRLIADELSALGVTVDCAPVLDIFFPFAHDIIGDRAFGSSPVEAKALGQAAQRGLSDGGIIPVAKHIPGHGRAQVDSHLSLPVVETPRTVLSETDFAAFQELLPGAWAMTAHIVYTDVDSAAPATFSARVIADVIRGEIGFSGILLSDDLGMKALSGSFAARARQSIMAGCDIALHCSGNLSEMEEIAGALSTLSEEALARYSGACGQITAIKEDMRREDMLLELTDLLENS